MKWMFMTLGCQTLSEPEFCAERSVLYLIQGQVPASQEPLPTRSHVTNKSKEGLDLLEFAGGCCIPELQSPL